MRSWGGKISHSPCACIHKEPTEGASVQVGGHVVYQTRSFHRNFCRWQRHVLLIATPGGWRHRRHVDGEAGGGIGTAGLQRCVTRRLRLAHAAPPLPPLDSASPAIYASGEGDGARTIAGCEGVRRGCRNVPSGRLPQNSGHFLRNAKLCPMARVRGDAPRPRGPTGHGRGPAPLSSARERSAQQQQAGGGAGGGGAVQAAHGCRKQQRRRPAAPAARETVRLGGPPSPGR